MSWQVALLILFGALLCFCFVAIIVEAMIQQKHKHRIARLRGHNPYAVGRDAYQEFKGARK